MGRLCVVMLHVLLSWWVVEVVDEVVEVAVVVVVEVAVVVAAEVPVVVKVVVGK